MQLKVPNTLRYLWSGGEACFFHCHSTWYDCGLYEPVGCRHCCLVGELLLGTNLPPVWRNLSPYRKGGACSPVGQ